MKEMFGGKDRRASFIIRKAIFPMPEYAHILKFTQELETTIVENSDLQTLLTDLICFYTGNITLFSFKAQFKS